MATVRRKGKSSKKTANRSPRKDSLNDTTGDEENDSDQPDRGQSPFSNMSLDVLAQVASETLEKEPRGGQRQSPRRLTRRSVQSRDHLNLTQIKALSSKSLVDFFSEPRADEIKRNYTFVCYLMPENCQEQFSSFGNDSRARLSMKNHLHHHLKELSAAEENEGETFHAEPMPARRRRLAEAAKRNKKAFTSIKTKSKPDILILPKGKLISLSELANANRSSEESSPSKRKFRVEQDEGDNLENASPVNDDDGNPVSKRRAGEDYLKTKTQKKMTRFHGKQTGPSSGSKVETHISAETERRIEENEQFIVDLLARTQPHMDHCYTTIFGKKRGTDAAQLEMELSSGEEEEELSSGEEEITVDVGDSSSYYGSFYAQTQRIAEPILLFRRTPGWEETPMVCCEEVIGREELEGEGETDEPHNGEKPYPPMPKSALAKKGRIPVPEENVSFSEEEELTLSPKRRRKSTLKEGSVEWERKRALRCIRELKAKRREDSSSVPLVCKICKDKTFTACATLMYHYRSHAGIKPFVCLICNTTFTRQHSLNYHMLIHNNQSRFTCKDCGRKFRHPSHFKEHLRRHTGETPFQCMDCSQKFKTRNTYKRHLKTRHGKLLTAAGIQMLSREEFLLVRTKPYRNREESEEEDIPEEDLVDSGEDTVADINFTAPSDSAVPVLPVITQTTDNLPLQLTAEQLSAPALHGHVLPVSSGHYLVPVDLQFIMSS